MGNCKYFFALVALITILVGGCSNDDFNFEQYIIVDKRVGKDNRYEELHEIRDNDQVQKVLDILDNINWENAKMEMIRPPDYQFVFQYKDPNIEAKAVPYSLWIGPNKDKVELIMGDSSYIQLNKEKSAELVEILIGEKISDL